MGPRFRPRLVKTVEVGAVRTTTYSTKAGLSFNSRIRDERLNITYATACTRADRGLSIAESGGP